MRPNTIDFAVPEMMALKLKAGRDIPAILLISITCPLNRFPSFISVFVLMISSAAIEPTTLRLRTDWLPRSDESTFSNGSLPWQVCKISGIGVINDTGSSRVSLMSTRKHLKKNTG